MRVGGSGGGGGSGMSSLHSHLWRRILKRELRVQAVPTIPMHLTYRPGLRDPLDLLYNVILRGF